MNQKFIKKIATIFISNVLILLVGIALLEWAARSNVFAVPQIAQTQDAYEDYLHRLIEGGTKQTYTPHPYRGFVPSIGLDTICGPGFPKETCVGARDTTINSLGFYGPEFKRTKPPKTIRIGITGGSITNLFIQHAGTDLGEALRQFEPFRDAKIEIINLAVPAYKQPQQMFTAQTLVLAGYEFDAIINFSGVNEIYHAGLNLKNDTAFIFPSRSPWATSDALGTREGKRAKYALLLSATSAPTGALADSILVRWYWSARLLKEEQALLNIAAQQDSQEDLEAQRVRYMMWSSFNDACKGQSCNAEFTRIWIQSSLATNNFLHAADIKYFDFEDVNHFTVAPSQLHPEDAKFADGFWTDADLDTWFTVGTTYKVLREQGLRFYNLNDPYVFEGFDKPAIHDRADHLTPAGYQQLAVKVAQYVHDGWTMPDKIARTSDPMFSDVNTVFGRQIVSWRKARCSITGLGTKSAIKGLTAHRPDPGTIQLTWEVDLGVVPLEILMKPAADQSYQSAGAVTSAALSYKIGGISPNIPYEIGFRYCSNDCCTKIATVVSTP